MTEKQVIESNPTPVASTPSAPPSVTDETVERAPAETLRYPNGSVYVGDVLNGKKHGYGTETLASGSTYTGEWFNDRKHGTGKKIFSSGLSFEGTWNKGQRHGQGVEIYPD
jgi:hypothetical protein